MVGDVGGAQLVGIGHQDPRHVERDVAVADDDGARPRQVRRHLLVVRMCVVPADEFHCGDAAGQIFTGYPQRFVGLGADGVDHRVVVLGQFARLHMLADGDVAEEPEPRVTGCLLELCADRLDLRMVGCDAGAHQSPGCGQHLQHVDVHVDVVRRFMTGVRKLQQRRRGEIARRS